MLQDKWAAFSLRAQLCRASVSVLSNIAEGFARNSRRDFAHFLDIARGSCSEVQSSLNVALDVGYVISEEFERLYDGAKAIAALIGRLTTAELPRRPTPEIRS